VPKTLKVFVEREDSRDGYSRDPSLLIEVSTVYHPKRSVQMKFQASETIVKAVLVKFSTMSVERLLELEDNTKKDVLKNARFKKFAKLVGNGSGVELCAGGRFLTRIPNAFVMLHGPREELWMQREHAARAVHDTGRALQDGMLDVVCVPLEKLLRVYGLSNSKLVDLLSTCLKNVCEAGAEVTCEPAHQAALTALAALSSVEKVTLHYSLCKILDAHVHPSASKGGVV